MVLKKFTSIFLDMIWDFFKANQIPLYDTLYCMIMPMEYLLKTSFLLMFLILLFSEVFIYTYTVIFAMQFTYNGNCHLSDIHKQGEFYKWIYWLLVFLYSIGTDYII